MTVTELPTPAITATEPTQGPPGWDHLRTAAEMYADHQKSRIAQEGRVRSATVDPSMFEAYIAAEREQEQALGKQLERLLQTVAPIGVLEWAAVSSGIGDKLLGRLLGHLGHPRLAEPKYWAANPAMAAGEFGDAANPKRKLVAGESFERTVGQLWQYCGHGRADRRRAGMTQDEAFALGNPRCKMLVHLLAESVVKAQVRKDPDDAEARIALGPLGAFYLAEKAKYAVRVHSAPCSGGYVPAGPGKVVFSKCKLAPVQTASVTHSVGGGVTYAQAGDPFQKGHVNAIALRHLGKEILRQLWLAAE